MGKLNGDFIVPPFLLVWDPRSCFQYLDQVEKLQLQLLIGRQSNELQCQSQFCPSMGTQ